MQWVGERLCPPPNWCQSPQTSRGVIQIFWFGVLCGAPRGRGGTDSSGVRNPSVKGSLEAQRQCRLQSQPINIFTVQWNVLSQLQSQQRSMDSQTATGGLAKKQHLSYRECGENTAWWETGIFSFEMLMNIEALGAFKAQRGHMIGIFTGKRKTLGFKGPGVKQRECSEVPE